jgi:hypothetical protein
MPGPEVGPGAGEQLGLGAVGHDAAVADHDDVVGDHLDLVEEVGGQEHRGTSVRVPAEEVAHPPDARGVETVGGLVQDEDVGVAEQGVGDPEALPHSEGVVPHPPACLVGSEADELEHLVDPAPRESHHLLAQAEDLPTRSAGVLC